MTATEAAARRPGDGFSRREFLRFGGLGALGLSAAEQKARAAAVGKPVRRCIFLLLTGGPSQIDTFDPKPLAPNEVRGPFRPISTAVPGVYFSELLPLLAQRAGQFALVRSLWHEGAPIHETGQQLLQTGRLLRDGITPPSLGSLVARSLGARNNLPPYAVLPRMLGPNGVSMWVGQGAGCLGSEYEPFSVSSGDTTNNDNREAAARDSVGDMPAPRAELRINPADAPVLKSDPIRVSELLNWAAEPDCVRRAYGESEFGRSCLMARRLIEQGARFVTANMYDSLAERLTWDCHANAAWAPTTLADYRHTVCPEFDCVASTLLDDLHQRGLLKDTLVVAAGEFGRTPRINDRGGRDHWPGVWSALLAGAGIPGGMVLGASDARGSSPAERPVHPAELAATILHILGVDLSGRLVFPEGKELPLVDAPPIAELLGSAPDSPPRESATT
jgi:uncharacterized protein (DUF1501 family)